MVVEKAFKSKSGPENADGIKKSNAVSKRIMQPETFLALTEKFTKDQNEVHTCSKFKSNLS